MIRLNGYRVKDSRFPDNTFHIGPDSCEYLKMLTDSQDAVEAFGGTFTLYWSYEDPAEMGLLHALVYHLKDSLNAAAIGLVMPYIPNARMDRTHNAGEVHTLKHFCRFINDLHFQYVMVMDPHSDVSTALLDHIILIDPADLVISAMNTSQADYFFFPDAGAAKRYASDYNYRPYLVGEKDRDWATGRINGLVVKNPMNIQDDFTGRKILIIDDICSRGGTFLHAGRALKKMGFGEVNLCVTHCEKTIFAGKLLAKDSPIDHIFTTDTIFRGEHDKISVMAIEVGETHD